MRTTNRGGHAWLRDVANARVHGITGCVPQIKRLQERPPPDDGYLRDVLEQPSHPNSRI